MGAQDLAGPELQLQQNSYEGALLKMLDSGRRLQEETTATTTNTLTIDVDMLAAFLAFLLIYLFIFIPMVCCIGIAEVVFMFLYGNMVAKKPPLRSDVPNDFAQKDDFSVGCFECFSDFNYCLHGCFCGLCRFADTQNTAGVMNYYATIIAILGAVIACNVVLSIIANVLMAIAGQPIPIQGLSAIFQGLLLMWFRQ